MRGDTWNVQVDGIPDGTVDRLGLGHAWIWTRASGKTEVFDCGLTISHVLEYMAKRIGRTPHQIDMVQA